MPGLPGGVAEAQGQHETTARSHQVDLPRQGDIAVFGAIVVPGQLMVLVEIAPPIGDADKTHRAPEPIGGAGQSQSRAVPLGEKHRPTFQITHPGGVALA